MPITYAKTDEQIEEERRLLYVGVTRARVHLCALLGAVPLARRPRPTAGPAASSTGCAPARRRRRAAAAPGGAAGGVERGVAGGRAARPRAGRSAARPAAGSAAARSPTRAR